MTNKAKIRIIKKNDAAVLTTQVKTEAKSKRAVARDMVTNVSNWVNDFQSRKRDETKIAFEQLFVQNPQPSGS
jgi:hypothetical protein